jgi:hypothetical protein
MAGKVPTSVTTNAAGVKSIAARVPSVALEQTGRRQGNAIQGNTALSTAPARANPRTVSGLTTLHGVAFGVSATVTIPHLLGRAYIGWHAHSAKLGPAVLYETTSADKTRYLVLVNSTATAITCDLDVW